MYRSKSSAFLFGFFWCISGGLSAGPVDVDPATPTVTVTSAANGVPLINIANPNGNGLSHNKFTKYNVESQGQILNNATGPSSTQLGGWVNANPNLTRSANTILNEVTSTQRSLLNGYIEVAGQKADVIIANPNGISVNGGGFINTGRATLTTGQPQFNTGGSLNGFNISGGDILIEGQGFNANNIDSAALFAKTIQLNAAVYAKDLRITGGSGTVDINGNLISTANTGTGVSIDASALGAVYANSITLIGTEKGVGVNLPPEIKAQNNLNITAGGRISFQKVSASTITAMSDADMRLSDRVHANAVNLDATTTLALNDGNAILSASDTMVLAAMVLDNQGEILAGFDEAVESQNIAATAILSVGTFENQGNLQAAGTLDITADSVNNRSGGSIQSDKEFTLNADSINNAAGGDISGIENLIMRGKGSTAVALLDNEGEIKANNIDAELTQLDNKGILHGSNSQILNVGASIDNAVGAEITSDGALDINSIQGASSTAVIDNRGLISAEALDVGADSITNTGAFYSRSNLKINAKNLDNRETILGDTGVQLLIIDTLKNRADGEIHSGGDLLLAADEGNGKTVLIDNHGLIQAEGNINAYANTFNNTSTAPSTSSTTSQTDHEVINRGSQYDYDIVDTYEIVEEVTSSTPSARILAGEDILVDMDELNNEYGLIAAAGDVTLTGGTVNNVGTVLTTTTRVVTRKYRKEKYCDDYFLWWCIDYDYRAVLVDTNTSNAVAQQAYSDTSIVAGGTLTTDVITLSNTGVTSYDGGLYRIGAQSLDSAPTAGNGSLSGTNLVPTLPAGSYGVFIVNTDPGHPYLIESNPLYTDKGNFFNSDYMLDQLDGFDSDNPYKKLGDAAYETHWVADQVTVLSKQRRLSQFGTDTEQFQGLMNNALALQEELDLEIGISLSQDQIAALDRSIVWMEYMDVGDQTVLAPVVYLAGDINNLPATAAGPQISGGEAVNIQADNLNNQGDIRSAGTMAVSAGQIANDGGRIQSSGTMAMQAQGSIVNTSGEIAAGGNLDIEAERLVSDRYSQEKTYRYTKGSEIQTELGVGSRISSDQNVNISTGQGVKVTGGTIEVGSSVSIDAGSGDIQLLSAEKNRTYGFKDGGVESRGSSKEQYGSGIQAGADATLATQGNVHLQASSIQTADATKITAGGDVVLDGAEEESNSWIKRSRKESGFFSSTKITEVDAEDVQTYAGSGISAGSVDIQSEGKIEVTGSQIVADDDVQLVSADDIIIQAGQESQRNQQFREEKKSGLFSSGGLSLTLGSQKTSTDANGAVTTAAASVVGSIEGDVNILTDKTYTQTGSDLVTPAGDINITAAEVNIEEARETNKYTTETKFKQSGLSVSLSNPIIDTVQTAQRMKKAAKKTDDPRMQALAAATAGLSAYNTLDAVQQGQAVANANLADQVGGIKVGISLGTSKSSSNSSSSSDTARGSTLTAGGDINIKATSSPLEGEGDVSGDINIQGSDLAAGENIKLQADNDITLQSAKNYYSRNNESDSSSASVGVSFNLGSQGYGFSLDLAASKGEGEGEGNAVAHSNTHVTAGNKLTIESGNDTTLRGAVAQGEQVQATVGGDLTIESQQDIDNYHSESRNGGFSLSIPIYGTGFSVSLNYGEGNMDSEYASVTEQSGIKAGDEGFQIDVNGHTQLTGAVIASTDTAVDNNKNSFDTGSLGMSDIHNYASYEADSTSFGIGYSSNGVGIGTDGEGNTASNGGTPGSTLASLNGFSATPPVAMSAEDDAESTTRSGISGIAGDQGVRSDKDGTNALEPIFNEEEINAGFEIVGAFNKEVGTFVNNRVKEADQKKEQAKAADRLADDLSNGLTDIERQALRDHAIALRSEAASIEVNWGAGGTYRQIVTAFTAAASGNINATNLEFVQNMVVNYVQQKGASYIGDLVVEGVITEGSPLHAAMHAIVACAGAAASNQSCSSGAAGAAASSLLTGLFSETSPEETLSEREAKRNLIVSLVTGIAAVTDIGAAEATAAAGAAVDNNWLATQQKVQYRKELEQAKTTFEKILIAGKWAAIGANQDVLTIGGVVEGLVKAGWDDVSGLAQFLLDPIKGLRGLKEIITNEQIRNQVGNAVVKDIEAQIVRMEIALQEGGSENAIQLGQDLGVIIWRVGTLVTGIGAAARAGVTLAKVGIKVSTKMLQAMKSAVQLAKAEGKGLRGIPTKVVMCFVPGTLVLMADGSTKPIEEIEPGEWVMGDDPEDRKPAAPFEVQAKQESNTHRIVSITIDDSDGIKGGYIESTGQHPYWTENRGWQYAEKLNIGDILLDSNGDKSYIVEKKIEQRDSPTYNLSIDEVHAYFVVTGDRSVLVHNVDPIRFNSKTNRWHGPNGQFVESPTAEQMRNWARSQGWTNTNTTQAGFETWSDANGQKRMKIKPASTQSGLHANSQRPRVTIWDANGQRVDGFKRPVAKKSVTAHAPLKGCN